LEQSISKNFISTVLNDLRTVQVVFVADVMYGVAGAFGVTAGAHRYWTHKSYKAKLPLRVLLAALYLITGMVKDNYFTLTTQSFGV
jgi:stearoyl-CoA desaturase (delta-9 desaturase)